MNPADIREAQACACLEAADLYREPLLALATKLCGNADDGKDLLHAVILNCHDAIQRNGFAGDKYQFYLRATIHNHFKRQKQRGSREVPTDFQDAHAGPYGRTDEMEHPWYAKLRASGRGPLTGTPVAHEAAAAQDEHAQLAEQVMTEVRIRFSDADRIILRLHVDGYSSREIAELIGRGEHTGVWRRLDKMKDYLRQTFLQAWAALGE